MKSSFLYTLVLRLKAEEHVLLKDYRYKASTTSEGCDGYILLKFPIIPGAEENGFFEGYNLEDYHLRIDQSYSNEQDWLSIAHCTLAYRSKSDNSTLNVHIYFDKNKNIWSVRANKRENDEQEALPLNLDARQTKKMEQFSGRASSLLDKLCRESDKRYWDALDKKEELDGELTQLSADLSSRKKRKAYRKKAEAFKEILHKLDEYNGLQPRQHLIDNILAWLDSFDKKDTPVLPVSSDFKVGKVDAESAAASSDEKPMHSPEIVERENPKKLLASIGLRLLSEMQTLIEKVDGLLGNETKRSDFFERFSDVEDLNLKVLELTFLDSGWKRPDGLVEKLDLAQSALNNARSKRVENIRTIVWAYFGKDLRCLEFLSDTEAVSLLQSVWDMLDSFRRSSIHEVVCHQIDILKWHFENKPALYKRFLHWKLRLSSLAMAIAFMLVDSSYKSNFSYQWGPTHAEGVRFFNSLDDQQAFLSKGLDNDRQGAIFCIANDEDKGFLSGLIKAFKERTTSLVEIDAAIKHLENRIDALKKEENFHSNHDFLWVGIYKALALLNFEKSRFVIPPYNLTSIESKIKFYNIFLKLVAEDRLGKLSYKYQCRYLMEIDDFLYKFLEFAPKEFSTVFLVKTKKSIEKLIGFCLNLIRDELKATRAHIEKLLQEEAECSKVEEALKLVTTRTEALQSSLEKASALEDFLVAMQARELARNNLITPSSKLFFQQALTFGPSLPPQAVSSPPAVLSPSVESTPEAVSSPPPQTASKPRPSPK